MARPRVVFFDIGGTLWSSPTEDPTSLRDCYTRGRDALVRAVAGVPPVEALIDAVEHYFAEWEDVWRVEPEKVQQPPTAEYVLTALRKLDVDPPPDALTTFTNELLEVSVGTARALAPEAGMKEALQDLQNLGVRLACVSNAFMGAATLNRIMDERGLGPHLDLTVSSCDFGWRKPHASIYEEALHLTGAAADEAVFVGDRLDADVQGPSAVGMRTVLTQQYRQEDPSQAPVQPDAVITHLGELPGVIDAMLRGS